MELKAYLGLNEIDMPIKYWRTKTGLEVDFILDDGNIAIEVKISDKPDKSELKGLISFSEDYHPKYAIVVCLAPHKRLITIKEKLKIQVLPWQVFLKHLWRKDYI